MQNKKISLTVLSAFVILLNACAQNPNNNNSTKSSMKNENYEVNKTEAEWKKQLTAEQYEVLRQKGTERPHTGKYNVHNEKGIYKCAACGNELFSNEMKFDSHCGWPSFDREIAGGKIKTITDHTLGMSRTEILCGRCGSHLGHIFDDGPTETGQRYCVNSVSLEFEGDTLKVIKPKQE